MEEVDENTRLAIEKSKLTLPAKPVVEAVEVFPYVDTVGNDALEVFVVISDATQDEELKGKAIMQIKSSIHSNLQNAGVFLFPYIHFYTRSEFESRNDTE